MYLLMFFNLMELAKGFPLTQFRWSWSPLTFHTNYFFPLVVLSEVVFKYECRATYSSSLRAKLILAPLGMPK